MSVLFHIMLSPKEEALKELTEWFLSFECSLFTSLIGIRSDVFDPPTPMTLVNYMSDEDDDDDYENENDAKAFSCKFWFKFPKGRLFLSQKGSLISLEICRILIHDKMCSIF